MTYRKIRPWRRVQTDESHLEYRNYCLATGTDRNKRRWSRKFDKTGQKKKFFFLKNRKWNELRWWRRHARYNTDRGCCCRRARSFQTLLRARRTLATIVVVVVVAATFLHLPARTSAALQPLASFVLFTLFRTPSAHRLVSAGRPRPSLRLDIV